MTQNRSTWDSAHHHPSAPAWAPGSPPELVWSRYIGGRPCAAETMAHALTAAKRGIPVHFHTPTEVKAAVTGSGRAEKAQVTTMVTRILSLSQAPRPADAADALALALCHAWRRGAPG